MPASIEQQWKPEEDQRLRDSIKRGMQLKQIAAEWQGRSRKAIECRVYTLGLKSGQPRTKHSKDEAFWSVPNALNSYYAGLMAADGSVNTNRRHTLAWACAVKDEPYMRRFVKETRYTGTISHFSKKSPSSETISFMAGISISACQRWNEDLARHFNIVPNKTYRLRPPNLHSDYLLCCYLVGLLDGDGALSWGRKQRLPHIAYGSASRDIVDWVFEFVESRFPFHIREGKKREVRTMLDGRYYHYSIYGLRAVKLIEFMRKLPVPHYARKWDNPDMLAIIDEYRAKWPEWFAPDYDLWFDEMGALRCGRATVAA